MPYLDDIKDAYSPACTVFHNDTAISHLIS